MRNGYENDPVWPDQSVYVRDVVIYVGYRRGTGPVPELGAIFRPVPELGPRQPRLGTGPKNTNRVTIWGASSVEVG